MECQTMPTSSSLGRGYLPVAEPRHRHIEAHRHGADPEPEDCWAPCPTCRKDKKGRAKPNKQGLVKCSCKCVDQLGYHRRQHDFSAEPRYGEGRRCLYCGVYQEIALCGMGRR